MLKIASAIILACVVSTGADARARRAGAGLHPDCNVTMPCAPSAAVAQVSEDARQARGKYISRQLGIGGVAPRRGVR